MKRIYLFLLTVCFFAGAQAQKFYNLRYCLELGLQNNYDLRIAHNNEEISDNNATWANAGLLPTLDFSAGYTGNIDKSQETDRAGVTTKTGSVFDQGVDVGLNLNWTLFDGFNMTADYKRLRELKRQGETNTRIAIEDMVANIASEYYNFIQQKIRLKNYLYAVSLSKERVRVAEMRHNIGSGSRLDFQQALVDFNADSAQYIKQQEALHTSRIRLNELMAVPDVDLNTGYGYTYNKYDSSSPTRKSGNWGFNAGLTLGFNLFDGNRRREFHNARLEIENSELAHQQLEQSLRADLMNMWQAYKNNLNLLNLERQNLITARDNHDIAIERYMQGDLSGIEMREAQQSLLDAEERILSVQYDIKVCEISLLQLSGKILDYLR